MSDTPETLTASCAQIAFAAGEAITWIREVRKTAPRLDREASGLIDDLRRRRMFCNRLAAAAERPVSVGFFGLSQAGKSYLISALASGANGEVETRMEGKLLNFVSHVNPPGGGKEATGLTTRFTRIRQQTPVGFPVCLKLLSQADLIKIFANIFFFDFDSQRVAIESDVGKIRHHLAALEAKRQPQPLPGLTEDDVIDVMDYCLKRFHKAMEPLMGDYWATAVALAPRLRLGDRAALFSLLWGGFADLTRVFQDLNQALDRLGYLREVCAPLEALVKEKDGVFSQSDSIMNVDILDRLGQDANDTLAVMPKAGGEAVALPRSILAALSSEMRFELAEKPWAEMLEQIDLLDFPGYRGRLKVQDLSEARSKLEGRDPVAGLVLRGKVAYLFERYTDDQEMNALVLCTPSNQQSDVNDVGDVLTSWIETTQGKTVEERARRKPGLLWALTKFDMRLNPRPGETIDLMRNGWGGMIRMALLERFENFAWVHDWTKGKPFDNLFLVRKPGMAGSVIETNADNREAGILPQQQSHLQNLRGTFIEDASVARHVRTAAEAWDAMMTPNDGGMVRLAGALAEVARPSVKLERIREQVEAVRNELLNVRLGPYYYAEGADAVARKKEVATQVVTGLSRIPTTFGEILFTLHPSPDRLRALYVRTEAGGEAVVATSSAPTEVVDAGLISLDDLLGGGGESSSGRGGAFAPATSERAVQFAKTVISSWITHLRQLAQTSTLQRLFGLSDPVVQGLTDELITGALRFGLEQRLVSALSEAELQSSATRSRLVDRQVRVVCTIIGDYVDWLGYSQVPLEERPVSKTGKAVFSPPPAVQGVPQLDSQPLNYSAFYIVDWFEAFRHTTIENAGHAAGSEIRPEQNDRLGGVLRLLLGR